MYWGTNPDLAQNIKLIRILHCSATDGVGTKVILAAELGIYEGIGQDLVGMCSNDLLCNKAKPLFFRLLCL